MRQFIYRRRTYSLPETWDELTPKQFLQVIDIILSDMELRKARLLILKSLLQMSRWRFFRLNAELLNWLLHYTLWVEDNPEIAGQLVPFIDVGLRMYGPRPGFENVRAAEFHFADMYYITWRNEKDVNALYRFLAVLYRPGKHNYDIALDKDGDQRVPFNPNTLDYYSTKFKKVSQAQIHAVLWCYESWRKNLEAEHPKIFTISNNAKASMNGWFPVFRGIAGGSKYGALSEVEQMYIHTLLLELDLLKEEELELKRRFPEQFKQ